MSLQNHMNTASKSETRGITPVAGMQVNVQKGQTAKCPSVEQILSELTALPPSLSAGGTETLQAEEQENLFRSLQEALRNSEGGDEAGVEALKDTRTSLDRLWECKSDYLVRAADALANGSRDSSWRLPYGQAGILDFFLRLIASSEVTSNDLLLHSLRLVGNSCADTDENRSIVVKDNFTLAFIRHFLNPGLIPVVIPVLYNACIDFEPAQTQAAENRIAYILVKLIKDNALDENEALLDFSYELIELVSGQGKGVEHSPDGIILLLTELVVDKDITFPQFSCVVNCLMKYLENERFQNVCVSNGMVENVLSVLHQSFSIEMDRSSVEEAKALVQLQLNINQSLAEVSGSDLFAKFYPLNSPLVQTLKSWLTASDDQLQICSCIMLGNLARSDEVCEAMVRDSGIHKELVSILKSDARGAVLHSSLSFLKNLAIAGDNRRYLGDAGIIPAISRLWGYETVPQVQFAATSIARQLIISSVENISRLLDTIPEGDTSENKPTYLSLLLALFEKTDSAPIKTEIGRIVASVCRTLSPKARGQNNEAKTLLGRLFSLHEGVARPVGTMITQTQWPVVRSEGWFALALMASSKQGSLAVVDCLQNMEVYSLLEETLSADSANEADESKLTKDRDNTIILVQELLKSDPDTLPADWRSSMEGLMNSHVSRHLREIQVN